VRVDGFRLDWMYVTIRRRMLFVEDSMDRGVHWAAFEPSGGRPSRDGWSGQTVAVHRTDEPLGCDLSLAAQAAMGPVHRRRRAQARWSVSALGGVRAGSE
jgi:hypothetical protein